MGFRIEIRSMKIPKIKDETTSISLPLLSERSNAIVFNVVRGNTIRFISVENYRPSSTYHIAYRALFIPINSLQSNIIMSQGNTSFDAPRPAVTNRLGKKRTDELIRADGDTWQEYLAVSEKVTTSTLNGSKRGGAFSSLFGKKNKNKQSSNRASNTGTSNGNDSSNLIIRSYFQNLRTGRKVWDEPPSGASIILPASEEMRRMAELQLGELYVKTTSANGIEDLYENDKSATSNDKKKKSFLRKGNATSGSSSGGPMSENSSAVGRVSTGRRIRYKPESSLNTPRSAADQQLEEAIRRSMAESYGSSVAAVSGAPGGNVETEEEILRRVLEESRLEAMSSSGRAQQVNDYYNEDYDRKPSARKTSTQRR